MNFIKATEAGQGLEVFGQWIDRARFGNHIRLARLARQFNEALMAADIQTMAAAMSAYFDLCGLDTAKLSGFRQLEAFRQLVGLNSLKGLLPFQSWEKPPDSDERKPYEYEGRNWAWYVHKLASRYSWAPETIWNLWPEEASAYLQEIMISEFDELDEARSLTELGYKYDKFTKEAKFFPTPRPGWMVPEPKETKIKIKKSLLPPGKVISLEEMAHDIKI